MEAKGREKGESWWVRSGLEPRTNGLKGRCSTIELRTRTQHEVVYQTSQNFIANIQAFDPCFDSAYAV